MSFNMKGTMRMRPLGCKLRLPENVYRAFQAIEQFNCDYAHNELERKYGWPKSLTRLLERETKRFLAICFFDRQQTQTPCCNVDEFWHLILERKQEYKRLLRAIGYEINHHPFEKASHVRHEDWATLASYRLMFGRIPLLWYHNDLIQDAKRPLDIQPSFIIKLTNLCNIDCTYCYVFHSADKSFRQRPKKLDLEVAKVAISKIIAYCRSNEITHTRVILHGGEPLLVGKMYLRRFLAFATEEAIAHTIHISFALQTNGLLLDKEWASIFADFNLGIGVSLDGTREVNDANRIDFRGNGSHDRVISALAESGLDTKNIGVLCVINPNSSGSDTFDHFVALGFRHISFLLPDANHNSRPLHLEKYKEFLVSVFTRWWSLDNPSIVVAPFEDIITMLLGGIGKMDDYGPGPVPEIVIETDGSIQPLDVLRICGENFTDSGLNIVSDDISSIIEFPLYSKICLKSDSLLPEKCLSCPVGAICSGGYLPHRYSELNGFHNPSVYCEVLQGIIEHISLELEIATNYART